MRAAFLLRRMRASRLLLGCVLLAALVTSTLLAALADFAAVTLTQAAEQQVSSSAQLSVQVNSTASAAQAGRAGRFIRASLRSALGPQGLAMQSALWSDPLNLPAPAGSGSQWIAAVAALGGITAHTRLVAGAWPQPSHAGSPYGVAVPVTDARVLRLRLGQSLPLSDADNGNAVTVRITGIYQIDDPAARYWGLSLVSASGVTAQPGFRTYGPFLVAAGTFAPGRLTVGQRSWLALPVRSTVPPGRMRGLAVRVQRAVVGLDQAQGFGGIVASTSLPQLLSGTAASYEVARSLLFVGGLELLLVAAAAMALTGRLLASQREPESALLAARGLTRRQVGLLAVVEAVTAAIAAGAAGVVLGALLARLLAGFSSSLRGVRQAGPALGQASLQAGLWPVLVVILLTAIVLAWPAAGSATAARVGARRGRPAVVATASRVGVDLAVVVLAALTAWQLRRYSAVAHSASGVLGVDPVLVVAPALILTAVALVPLRLLPTVTRQADQLAARGRRLTTALAAWQLSRRPVRQAGPALLVILAVGTSTLALSEELSWRQSVRAQAAMTVGADARIDVPPAGGTASVAAAVTARDVRAAMPVSVFDGGLSGQVVALNASTAASVVLLRPDQSRIPAAQLFRLLTPSARPAGVGLPGRPVRVAMQASLGSAPAAWQLGALAVSLSVQAADGVVYALPAGALPADGSGHLLTATIPAADRASFPLRLVGVTLAYQMPPVTAGTAAAVAVQRREVSMTISGFAASADAAGPLTRFAAGTVLGGWQRGAASTALASDMKGASGIEPAVGGWRRSGAGDLTVAVWPGDGQLVPPPGNTPLPISAAVTLTARPGFGIIPGIATSSFAAASGSGVGSTVVAAVGDYHVPVRIVAEVSSFPTVGAGSALIIDQGAVQALLAGVAAPPLEVTSWWLSTRTGEPPEASRGGVSVVSLRQVADSLLDSPIGAAPQQAALTIAAAVALLATLGFAVSVWASLTERRASNALLAALGVSRLSRARQLCLEQSLLAAPAAAIGLLAGAAIAQLLIPAVTLTATAARPTPPALVYLPVGWVIGLAAVVAVIPVLVAAATVASRPDPAAELRATGTA